MNTTSASLNLQLEVNTMVCTMCKSEPFSWLAEVFVCTVCGEFEYAFPIFMSDDEVEEGVNIDVR
jgi:hypothetical protein